MTVERMYCLVMYDYGEIVDDTVEFFRVTIKQIIPSDTDKYRIDSEDAYIEMMTVEELVDTLRLIMDKHYIEAYKEMTEDSVICTTSDPISVKEFEKMKSRFDYSRIVSALDVDVSD